METARLGRTFAVEIRGVDLSRELTEATFEAVREAWLDGGVAVFPGQVLDDDALVAFTCRLGAPFVHIRSQFHSPHRPEVMMVSNEAVPGRDYPTLGDGELDWHTDQAYTAKRAFGTILYCIETPSRGGDTEFCDLAAAYREMPETLARRVAGRCIEYSIDAPARTQGVAATAAQRRAAPSVAHPVVRRHPLRGLRALYVSPSHAVRLEPESAPADGESTRRPKADAELLDDLVAWVTRAEFRYLHRWRARDLVLWDNTRTMHRRTDFPSCERRILKRTGFTLPDA